MDVNSRRYEAQRAVLGMLLVWPEKLAGEIFHRLSPEDFTDASLRNLFQAAREIWLDRGPLDPVTLLSRAGQAYEPTVREALEVTATSANWEAYCDIVREESRLFQLHSIGMQLTGVKDPEEGRRLLAEAEGLLTERNPRRVRSYQELIGGYLDRTGEGQKPDTLDWGIEALNRNISISPGRFVILGADSSVGKTALALQLAYNLAKGGKRVGFFSYETSHEDAADRLVAQAAGVALPRTKQLRLSAEDVRRVVAEGEKAESIPLYTLEAADCTVEDIRALTLAGRYEVIVIDYVQMVPARAPDRWQVVTEVSMGLHRMAQRLGVTVLALSQVTPPEKDKKGRRRMLGREDLRESRQLLQDAEAILMMDLTDPADFGSDRVLQIVKNKDGPLGRIFLRFEPELMRFTVTDPPKGESYRRVMAALAEQRKADKDQKRAQIDGQSAFTEMAEGEGGPLPF